MVGGQRGGYREGYRGGYRGGRGGYRKYDDNRGFAEGLAPGGDAA